MTTPQRGARGEQFLDVGGERRALLLTNRALAELEQAVGKSALQIAQAARDQVLAVGDLAQLLRVGLEYGRRESGSGGKPVTLSDAYAVLDEVGFAAAAEAAILALAAVLAYRPSATGDGDPNQ